MHSVFIDRMNLSMIAMLPCLPTAPYRGRIVRLLHHFLNASQSNCLPLSAMTYFGFTPLLLIARSRKAQTCLEVGGSLKMAKPTTRRE